MTKDRLGTLRALQKCNQDSDDDVEVDNTATNFTCEYCDGILDEFFEQVNDVRSTVDSMTVDVDKVKLKHGAILAAPAGEDKLKDELDSLMAEIKHKANRVRRRLKVMEQNAEQDEQVNKFTVEVRIRKVQHATLSRQFVKVMNDYNACQVDYRTRCKARIQRQLEIAGKKTTDDQLEDMLENGNPATFTQGITVMETQQVKKTLADIEARHKDIVKLETSIRELHDMFIDVAILVENQGEMTDRIEYNVEQSVDFIETAKADTKKAVKYQSKARRKKIFLLICGVVLVIGLGSVLLGIFM